MDNVLLITLCIVLMAMSAILVLSLVFVGTEEADDEALAARPHTGPSVRSLPAQRVARYH